MAKYNAIKIERGSGGFGGPLIVKPEEGKDKLLFITGERAADDARLKLGLMCEPRVVHERGDRPV